MIEKLFPQPGAGLAIDRQSQDQGTIRDIRHTVRNGNLREAGEKFEAYFLAYLLKVMRATVPKSGLTENHLGEVFQSFYDEEIGKRAAQSGGIGMSGLILSVLADSAPPPSVPAGQPVRERPGAEREP